MEKIGRKREVFPGLQLTERENEEGEEEEGEREGGRER